MLTRKKLFENNFSRSFLLLLDVCARGKALGGHLRIEAEFVKSLNLKYI